MGNCIICGAPVDGAICESHEEDVAFEFRGDSPSQLTPGRYYRGSVDGYADFGVFVDVGDDVTGLLHRSELDRRLESLEWEPGDTVYVQVLDVRDNGNVDLGWSIRQEEREFRGMLVDAPDGEYVPDGESDDAGAREESGDSGTDESTGAVANGGDSSPTSASTETAVASTPSEDQSDDPAAEPLLERTTVDAIDEQVGSVVRLEGEIAGVRQTSGPTVFELRDETGTVECAAFEEAGVRAYPDVEVEDVVAIEGEVERRHGDLQVETEMLEILSGEDRQAIVDRLEEAIRSEARPETVEPLAADHDVAAPVRDELVEAATAIRRAVMEARPIVVRHSATADGYVAGAAIERAVLPLIREKHTREDAPYHYFQRRPLDGAVYGMDAATNDVTSMLEARDRHGEQLPLVVLVDAGSTIESRDGYDLLDVYDAERLVIDDARGDEGIAEEVDVAVVPALAGTDVSRVTSTALAATVAAHVNDDVRDDLLHLPAISYWEDLPEAYADLAGEAGYDETDLAERREAVALEAYYQSYKDKRELVADLLFGDGGGSEATPSDGSEPVRNDGLAAHVSEQFRAKLETELGTARENVEREEVEGVVVTVLDTDAFTHRFDFPTTTLLLDELHRRGDAPVTLGLDEDELHVRADDPVDVRDLGDAIADAVPEAGVRVVGGHDGRVEFLTGERAAVRAAAVESVAELLD